MNAFEAMPRLRTLSPAQQIYALQWFVAACDMESGGFTEPRADKPHADWALAEMEKAIEAAKKV